jgi:hypothetical protein
MPDDFTNDDAKLLERVERAAEERKKAGLDGLTGGLECVVINVQPQSIEYAARELLNTTGLEMRDAFETPHGRRILLGMDGCADFLITTRNGGENPFIPYNKGPKSEHMPAARLETFVYKCRDLEAYADIQKARGVEFLTDGPIETDKYLFLQTAPSRYTGNSTGFIQWKEGEGDYRVQGSRPTLVGVTKPDKAHLENIFELDHTATRVRAEERDAAIVEFMELTSYDFDFAVYVESLNSITNVARLSKHDYAQVFTSGIRPFAGPGKSGPTETYIHNYGLRVHHMAFRTENIEATFQALKDDGMEFLVELVGSREDGLKQTFSRMSPHTFLVNEYIHRYDGFDGFFTRSNVTELTRATEKQ